MEQSINQNVADNTVPSKTEKKKTGLIIGMIICIIIALGGIGFGIYGIIEVKNKSSEISDLKVQIEDKDGKITTLETDKIKVSDDSQTIIISDSDGSYATRDLKSKTLRLLGARNGLSIQDRYNNNTGYFVVYSSYMPTPQLIANELDEASKTYITLETTRLDKEKQCSYRWTDGVKADVDTALGKQFSDIFADSDSAYIDCISYDKANNDYYDLWGENLPKINGMSNSHTNGDFAYGSNSDAYYYHINKGRGGTCSDYIVGKITQVDKNQSSAYVDINAGAFSICMGNAGELYSDIEKGEIYRTIEQNNLNWDGLGLTEDDYKSLQSYRFKFNRNSDGIYSFSSIEKL